MFSKGVYVTTTEFGPYLCFPLTKHSSFEAMLIHSPLWEGDGLRRRASPRLLYQSDGTPETHTLKNTREKIPAAQQAGTAQGCNPKGQSRKLRGGRLQTVLEVGAASCRRVLSLLRTVLAKDSSSPWACLLFPCCWWFETTSQVHQGNSSPSLQSCSSAKLLLMMLVQDLKLYDNKYLL